MERVAGKKGGHNGCPPDSASHYMQEKENEEGVYKVDKNIDQMIAAWIQAKHLVVEHVRNQGQWEVVAVVRGCKSPLNTPRSYPCLNIMVIAHVDIVIEVEELMVACLYVDNDDCQCQAESNQGYI